MSETIVHEEDSSSLVEKLDQGLRITAAGARTIKKYDI